MDLGNYEAVTIYVTTCTECGDEIHSETKDVTLCALCQTVGQVLYLHYTNQYHRWKVLPVHGMWSSKT